jgi:hypothetical protein
VEAQKHKRSAELEALKGEFKLSASMCMKLMQQEIEALKGK